MGWGIFKEVGKFVNKYNKDPVVKNDIKNMNQIMTYASGSAQKQEAIDKQRASAEATQAQIDAERAAALDTTDMLRRKRTGFTQMYNPTGGAGDTSKAPTMKSTLGA